MKKHLLVVIATLSLVVLTGTQRASAQNLVQVTLNAPFTFYAGNTKLPAGHYMIREVGEADERLLELHGTDNKISVFLEAQDFQADSMPNKTQVLFKKYDDKEILYQIIVQDQKLGYEIVPSVHDKRAAKSGTTPTKHAVEATGGATTTKKPD